MYVNETQLKEFSLDSGLISLSDFSVAEQDAQKKNTSVGKILVSKGIITDDELRRIQAHILGVPFVSLEGQKIPFDVLSLIPEPIARNHNIIAFRKNSDKELEVAMLDTDDLPAIEFVKKKVGMKILPRLTDTKSMKSVLLQYQKTLKDEFGEIIRRESETIKEMPEGDQDDESSKLKEMAEDLPVVRIVNTLLKHAIIQNASDIHIEPLEQEMLVRYRIDGILHDAMTLPKSAVPSVTARIKVLADLKLDEKRLPQDGRFRMEIDGQKVSFRVSVMPTHFGEKTVMRLLRENAGGFTLEGLGFHGEALERVHKATRQKTGMILTTGPTGSGKTTTLYTLIDILNTPDVNISTIEDPIEYQIERVNQTQVKPEIGFTFANGLRSLVRQDPDIIMVGEIRDSETASLAINAALTGHLVLSTLHTNSAAGAMPRLLEMEMEAFLLSSTINVIIAQRLVRKLCDDKKKYTLSKSEIEALGKSVDLDRIHKLLVEERILKEKTDWEHIPFYKPKTDGESEDGYSGRVGIYEILTMSQTIKDLVVRNATSDEIEKQARAEGMATMIEDGIFKAVQGITTIEEVLRVISE